MFTLLSVHGYSRFCERSSGTVRTGQGEYTGQGGQRAGGFPGQTERDTGEVGAMTTKRRI